MAKKKSSKVSEDLDNINNSLDSILQEYKIIPKREKGKLLTELKRKQKKSLKLYSKTDNLKYKLEASSFNSEIKKIDRQTDRIFINYGVVDLHIKTSYLESIKNKEQYLDGLFNRKMKTIMNKKVINSVSDAKEYEGIIAQYSKKIKSTKFYDVELVENSINKLTNYRGKVNSYDYSDFINEKRQRIMGEVYESRLKKDLILLNKQLKKASAKEKKSINSEIKSIQKSIDKNFVEEQKESTIRNIKRKNKLLLNKKLKDSVKADLKGDIEDLENYLLSLGKSKGGTLIDGKDNIIEQPYKAVEKPMTVNGWLIGIKFNFF